MLNCLVLGITKTIKSPNNGSTCRCGIQGKLMGIVKVLRSGEPDLFFLEEHDKLVQIKVAP